VDNSVVGANPYSVNNAADDFDEPMEFAPDGDMQRKI
jgi:hypothetical protein